MRRSPLLYAFTQFHQPVANGPQAAQSDYFDPMLVFKLFTPEGFGQVLLSEIDPDHHHDRAFGLCELGLGSPELGYVSIHEMSVLCSLDLRLRVERDRYFIPDRPLSVYAAEARAAGRITPKTRPHFDNSRQNRWLSIFRLTPRDITIISQSSGPGFQFRGLICPVSSPSTICCLLTPKQASIKAPAEHREARIAINRSRRPGRPQCANSGHSRRGNGLNRPHSGRPTLRTRTRNLPGTTNLRRSTL